MGYNLWIPTGRSAKCFFADRHGGAVKSLVSLSGDCWRRSGRNPTSPLTHTHNWGFGAGYESNNPSISSNFWLTGVRSVQRSLAHGPDSPTRQRVPLTRFQVSESAENAARGHGGATQTSLLGMPSALPRLRFDQTRVQKVLCRRHRLPRLRRC